MTSNEMAVQNSLWFGKVVSWASEMDVSMALVLFFLVIFLASHLFLHRKKVHQAAGEAQSISEGDVQNTCVGDGKRVRSCDNSGASGAIVQYNDCQSHCSDEESKSLLFSSNPRAAGSGNVQDPLGSKVNVQQFSSFEIDPIKHKVFLSHSGAQKNFVEQLCVDLEMRGYLFPFFDQRHHSLPKGKDFVPLIKQAARLCHVAVIVLSEEFLCSKWPMIELAEFYVAKQGGNKGMNFLPLFYKLSVGDLDDRSIEDRWMPKWNGLASQDKRIDVTQWAAAVRALRGANGLPFGKGTSSKVCYRREIVQSIWKLSPGELLYDSAREMAGYYRICQVCKGVDTFVSLSNSLSPKGICSELYLGQGYIMAASLRFLHAFQYCQTFHTLGLVVWAHMRFCLAFVSGLQSVSKQFVEGYKVGASVLGLYGTSGFGKTTVSKGLCDYFAGEFVGRVCYVELGAKTRMKRQKLMLKTLCGIEEDVLNRLTDDRKGLKLLRDYMKWEPVFLVIDNVTNDESSRKEAHEYLMMGFHSKSKIMITARSKEVLQDLLPGVRFCMRISRLNEEEAGRIFLRSAAPMKCFSSLLDEERAILGRCIQMCLLEVNEDECLDEVESPDNLIMDGFPRSGAYHPLALSALGDFFYRLSTNTEMLHWKDSLEENDELMRDVLQSPSITSIIGLQFSTLSSREELLFLDIALYSSRFVNGIAEDVLFDKDYDFWVEWLSTLHEQTASFITRHLRDLKRSGMIDWEGEDGSKFIFKVHSLYKEFAVWYVKEHGVTGFKNAWGVFQPYGTSLGSHHPRSKCISDLVRVRVFGPTRSNIWALLKKRMQALQNVVLLQLYSCADLRELSLEGLDSLRHLEVRWLSNLVEVTLTRNSSSHEDRGIYESLQYVVLDGLDSLTHVPHFKSCTSLRYFLISNCQNVTNFEGVECPHLRELWLQGLAQHQLGRPPNFGSLLCLEELFINFDGEVDVLDALDVHVNPYNLKQGRPVKHAVHQGPEDSNEFNDHFDDDQYAEVFYERTIINMHLENHFRKEGLGILQKVVSHQYLKEWSPSLYYDAPDLLWSFNEGDNEVLRLIGSNGRGHDIEWRFKHPEEYDD